MASWIGSSNHAAILAYDRIAEPSFWEDVQERVIGETIGSEWKFDALIVDEGQDFEPQWSEIVRLFLKPDTDLLWLEDLDQSIRLDRANNSASGPAHERLAPNFIGFRTRANYRSPETIARYILRVLPFDFIPSNPLPGLGVGVATFVLRLELPARKADTHVEEHCIYRRCQIA
jgi:hypothetical protein